MGPYLHKGKVALAWLNKSEFQSTQRRVCSMSHLISSHGKAYTNLPLAYEAANKADLV